MKEQEEERTSPPMTTGIFKEHAFLITDLEKATNTYACVMQDLQSYVIFCAMLKVVQMVKPKSSALGKRSLYPSLRLNARSMRKVGLASKFVVG